MSYLQSVSFTGPVVTLRWPDFKATSSAKSILMQYVTTVDGFLVFGLDGAVAYTSSLVSLAISPTYVWPADYGQAQNDTDYTDFTTNFQTAANKRLNRTDNFGNLLNIPFNYAAAVPGLMPGLLAGTVNGYVPTASTAGVAVRSTTYVAGTGNAQRSFKSSSANDVNTTGTGAWQVRVTYLDFAMTGPYTDTINLNGTTAVATNNSNICFIEKIEIVKVGSGGGNAGTVSLFANSVGAGGTMGSIAVSDNSTFWAHHYVPTGVNCYLLGLRCGSTVTPGSSNVQITGSPLTANLPFSNVSGSIRHGAANAPISDYEWDVPLVIPGPNFIISNEKADSATASTAFVSFDYVQF